MLHHHLTDQVATERRRDLIAQAEHAIGFRLRNTGTLNWQRLVAALLCVALIPVATKVDALVALALAAAVASGLIAYEAVRFAEARGKVRAASRHG